VRAVLVHAEDVAGRVREEPNPLNLAGVPEQPAKVPGIPLGRVVARLDHLTDMHFVNPGLEFTR